MCVFCVPSVQQGLYVPCAMACRGVQTAKPARVAERAALPRCRTARQQTTQPMPTGPSQSRGGERVNAMVPGRVLLMRTVTSRQPAADGPTPGGLLPPSRKATPLGLPDTNGYCCRPYPQSSSSARAVCFPPLPPPPPTYTHHTHTHTMTPKPHDCHVHARAHANARTHTPPPTSGSPCFCPMPGGTRHMPGPPNSPPIATGRHAAQLPRRCHATRAHAPHQQSRPRPP